MRLLFSGERGELSDDMLGLPPTRLRFSPCGKGASLTVNSFFSSRSGFRASFSMFALGMYPYMELGEMKLTPEGRVSLRLRTTGTVVPLRDGGETEVASKRGFAALRRGEMASKEEEGIRVRTF